VLQDHVRYLTGMPLSMQVSLPVRIATAVVAGEAYEAYVSEYMGLEAIGTTATMVAINPRALTNEDGRLFPGGLDIRKLCDIANIGGQLGDLVVDHAEKYFGPLERGG